VGHLRVRPRKIPFSTSYSMGRIPVPTEILDARGSFLKHPERRRPNEPQETRLLGNAPRCLTAEQKKLWGEISHNLPPGVGKVSDRHAFEMLVRLMAKERADSINNNERGQLIKLLGSFGMTPADRSKISIDSTPLDEFQQFLIKPKPVRPVPAVSNKPAPVPVQ
jgi:phage terminase small subunit